MAVAHPAPATLPEKGLLKKCKNILYKKTIFTSKIEYKVTKCVDRATIASSAGSLVAAHPAPSQQAGGPGLGMEQPGFE